MVSAYNRVKPGVGITTLKGYQDTLFWIKFNEKRLETIPDDRRPKIEQTIDILKIQAKRFLNTCPNIKWKDFMNIMRYREECKKFFTQGFFADEGWDFNKLTDEEWAIRWDWVFNRSWL